MKGRFKEFLKHLGVGQDKFEKKVGLSRGFVNNVGDSIRISSQKKISAIFPELSMLWLLTGHGEMLKISTSAPEVTSSKHSELQQNQGFWGVDEQELDYIRSDEGVPYWNLQVSAGHSIVEVIGKQKPDGYVKGLPGADVAENILPTHGMSMEPEISSGALIGVRKINNWETLNTERIYLIITHDDRMIKRIEHDAENSEILWCVSTNYPRFKIYKGDIIEIQRVCFVHNPK